MNFAEVKKLLVPEGRVRRMILNGQTLWHWDQTAQRDIYPLLTHNYWISTTGGKSGHDTNWISSDKIPVTDQAVIDFYLYQHPSVGHIVAYDAKGTVLDYRQGNGEVYHVPPGTTHITLTGCTANYSASGFARQYAILTDLATADPVYVKDGLILWCDGRNNTGSGHDAALTTWKDLTGNGNDLISTRYADVTTPADTVRGIWQETGLTIDITKNQFLRTASTFDLGMDRTLELRVTPRVYHYMTFGFKGADRVKFRTQGQNWWCRMNRSDTEGFVHLSPGIPTPPVDVPITVTMTRSYDAEADRTTYRLYTNGVYLTYNTVSGDYRAGEAAYLLFGEEYTHLTVHSVRLYDRALTAEEILYNWEYDQAQL